ncbi:MAG: MnhB domain-containing protein [Candidatus Omnitrophica bacterium]|nr:MnhB domain-containing protein [Candidatus Omnitrophota bacterium]
MTDKAAGMSLIVKTVTRLTVGLILIYGFYLVLQSHVGPGGGFAGGVVIALSLIHLVLAFGRDAVLKKINQINGVCLMSCGAIAFLMIALSRLVSKNHFTGIVLSDIAISTMVGAGLFVVFLTLVLFIKESSGGSKQ